VLPGAMGFSKRVAIKRLRSNISAPDSPFVKALVNEARIGGLLHHANIVDVMEFDQVGPHFYLAMEFVDGVTLTEVIALCRRRRVLLPRFAVVDITMQVCRGLQYAHEQRDQSGQPLGLIHRDLKPSNIMVDLMGTVKICDFGIAKAASNLFNETATGYTKGTPRYMSPDQLRALPLLQPRSDVFSLGVVLFELLTTKPLFLGDSVPALTHQIVFGDIQHRLQEADDALPGCGRVLERALQRDPGQRYQDVASVGEEFRQLSRSYPSEAELSQVIARLMRAVDRTESREIRGSEELDFDASDTRVYQETSDDPIPTDAAPITVPPPDASGWTRFTSVFISTTDAKSPTAAPESGLASAPDSQPSAPTTRGITGSSPISADSRATTGVPLPVKVAGGLFGLLFAALLLIACAYGLVALIGRNLDGLTEVATVEPATPEGASERLSVPVETLAEPVEITAALEEIRAEPEEPTAEPEEPQTESSVPPQEPVPQMGEIRFYVEPWAEIFLDGEYKGTGRRPSVPYSVKGGAHSLRLVCEHEACPEGGRTKDFSLWVDGDTMKVDGQPVTTGKNWFCWDFTTMARCD